MHGNTVSAGKYKTRHLADMVKELSQSFQIHLDHGSRLQGVHLEMTGDTDKDGFSVTECLGGSMELEVEELAKRYESFCDPRLNLEQTLGGSDRYA
jgi:3-deoxy-7-phosphoheptulonate synthase